MKNLETAIGRAFDRDGKGGPLTWATDMLGKGVQGTAELPPWAIGAGSAAALGAGGYGAFKFGQTLFSGFGFRRGADGSHRAAVGFSPDLARELVQGIRDGFNVRTPTRSERLRLMTEEYLPRLADGIEALVRAKTAER